MSKFVAETTAEPLFLQMKAFILRYLREHHYRPGSLIPSENDFCAISEVSIRTVRRALAELERDGVVSRLRGRGTFLKSRMPEMPENRGTIGIMFSDMGFVTRPTFAALLHAMEERLQESGYRCHLYATGQREQENPLPLEQLLPQELPSGLIATSALNDADLSWLKRRKIPFCAFNAYRRHQVNQVRFDYAEAARAGLRYLAGCGCLRIVLCGGHFEQENDAVIYGNNLFRDSILAAAQEISPGPELCFYEIPQTHEGGARLALELWKSGIRPDAFFTTDPLPALGIQAAGKVRNRNDFELITCHGLPDHPEITSLRSPLADMGKAAVDMVIGACKGDPAKVRQKIFAPELIEAKSEVFSL